MASNSEIKKGDVSSSSTTPEGTTIIPEVHDQLCSHTCIDKFERIRSHNIYLQSEVDAFWFIKQDYLENEKKFNDRIKSQKADMIELNLQLFQTQLSRDHYKKQMEELRVEVDKLKLELKDRLITVDKFEIASKMVNGIINSQMGVKQKGGIGSTYATIAPPFNNNFTPVPKFSFDQHPEDEFVYGIGHVSRTELQETQASCNVESNIANHDSSNVDDGVVSKEHIEGGGQVDLNRDDLKSDIKIASGSLDKSLNDNHVCNSVATPSVDETNNVCVNSSVDLSVESSDDVCDDSTENDCANNLHKVCDTLPDSSTSCEIKDERNKTNVFENVNQPSTSGTYVPPHNRQTFSQTTNQFYHPQYYNSVDRNYYSGYNPYGNVETYYANAFDDRGYYSDRRYDSDYHFSHSPSPPFRQSYSGEDNLRRKSCFVCGHPSHLARNCKHWFKQQLDMQKQLSQLKNRASSSSGSRTDQADSETSEMDVRSKVNKVKRKKKPFWKTKKDKTKTDSKVAKPENPPKTVSKPKSEKPKMFKQKEQVFAWIPKGYSSSSDSSGNKNFHGNKIMFGKFVVDLPGTERSREPVSI